MSALSVSAMHSTATDVRPALVRRSGEGRATPSACSMGWTASATRRRCPQPPTGRCRSWPRWTRCAAEEVLQGLEALGIPSDEIGFARRTWIQPAGARVTTASVLMWADVLGSARMESRVIARNLGLMFVAGIIAGYGVVIDNPILIVGAMAVSPDLVPLIAASVGIVAGRWSLVRRGATTLILGLGLATLAAFGVVEFLDFLGHPAKRRRGERVHGVLRERRRRDGRRRPRRGSCRRAGVREPSGGRGGRGDLGHDHSGGCDGRRRCRAGGLATGVGRPRSAGCQPPLPDRRRLRDASRPTIHRPHEALLMTETLDTLQSLFTIAFVARACWSWGCR